MLRLLWIALATAVSIFFGSQWYMNSGLAAGWLYARAFGAAATTGAAASNVLAISGATTITVASLFVLVFACLAAVDFVKFNGLQAGLDRLRNIRRNGGDIDRAAFLRVFRDDDGLSRLATDYCDTLHEEAVHGAAGAGTRLRLTVPAAHVFAADLLVERPLFVSVFRYVPAFLWGAGIIALLAALLEGLVATQPASPDSLAWIAASLPAGLLALGMSALVAIGIGLLVRLAVDIRHQQTHQFQRRVEGAFHGFADADYLRDLTQTTGTDSATLLAIAREGAGNLVGRLDAMGDKIHQSLDANGETIGKTVAAAVAESLNRPLARLTDLSRRLAKDQSEQLGGLLKQALAAFEQELGRNFGDQLKEVNVLLQSTAAMATSVETTFSDAANALKSQSADQIGSLGQQIGDGLKQAADAEATSRQAMAEELRSHSRALSSEVQTHSRQFETLLNTLLNRIEYLTESVVAAGSADLTKTADSLSGLREVVESLVLSVAPILNQVVDTQQRIIGALEDEQSAGKVIARSAADMNAAARASRETVERFIVLAERLTESRHAMTGRVAGSSPAQPSSSPAAPAAAAADKSLSQAIRQLRETTEDGMRKLPKL